MFIIYGTKHRERRLGRRGDVCDGCLGMSPFDIVRIDAAPHLYYVPLRWKEERRLQECLRCGMRVPIASTVDGTFEGFDSLNDLALATNSRDELRQIAARLKLLHDREGEWLHETRARQFSELQAPLFRQALGPTGLVLVAALFVAAIILTVVSVVAHPWIAAASWVLGLVWLFLFWRWLVHRYVARRVKPRVRMLLRTLGMSFPDFHRRLAAQGPAGKRLARHFQRRTYREFDQENFRVE